MLEALDLMMVAMTMDTCHLEDQEDQIHMDLPQLVILMEDLFHQKGNLF